MIPLLSLQIYSAGSLPNYIGYYYFYDCTCQHCVVKIQFAHYGQHSLLSRFLVRKTKCRDWALSPSNNPFKTHQLKTVRITPSPPFPLETAKPVSTPCCVQISTLEF